MDKEKERLQKKYNDYVKQVTPTHNLWWNMAKAFVTGGIICCIGQFILNVCENYGLDQKTSGSWCSMLLILLSVLLTGLNLYPSIANWGGAGALVPITGFANGVAAPARKKDRFSELAARSLRLPDRSFYTEYFQAGCLDSSIGD